MEEFKLLSEWRLACRLGRRIFEITKGREHSAIAYRLREKAGELPIHIAAAYMSQSENLFKHTLRMAWGTAHEVEQLLFLGWTLEQWDYAEILRLSKSVYLVKSLLVKKLHHEPTTPF